MLNTAKYVLGSVNAISLLVIVLLFAVFMPISDKSFYKKEYKKNGTVEQTGVDADGLMIVTDRLLEYLKDDAKDLDVYVVFSWSNGIEHEFFNEREKAHMVDVKNLYVFFHWLRNLAAVIFLGSLLILLLLKTKLRKLLAIAYLTVFGLFMTFAMLIALAAIINFDAMWTNFHNIFFSNELWILDPATDLLINLVPLEFFMDLCKRIVIIYITASLLTIIGSVFALIVKQKSIPRHDV